MTHCKGTQVQDHINMDQANAELGVYIQPFSQTTDRLRVKFLQSGPVNAITREDQCLRMYDRYWAGAPAPTTAVSTFMAQYVHDSRAGFVLTDPQCERDYTNMHALLEKKDKQYIASRNRYHERVLPEYKKRREANPRLDEEYPLPPVDPLNTADRRALEIYRRGDKPIFTDAKPASSMDGKLDMLDGVALISRREPRWSYLRRRQIFRPVRKPRDNARVEVTSRGDAKRLTHEDGLS